MLACVFGISIKFAADTSPRIRYARRPMRLSITSDTSPRVRPRRMCALKTLTKDPSAMLFQPLTAAAVFGWRHSDATRGGADALALLLAVFV